MGDFRMPSLGADMESGTVTEWRVKPGDKVQRGDIVAVVDTEKSTIEIEIFESGVVERLLVGEGEEVPVGMPIAHIGTGAEAPAAPAPAPPAPSPAPPLPPPSAPPLPPPSAPPYVASPMVRHLAGELGVDLDALTGSAPGGRVTRADVEKAARPVPALAAKGPSRPAAPPVGAGRRPRSSPLARRLAAEQGLDLSGLAGTGPGGAVVEADVSRAAGAAAAGRPVSPPAGAPVSPPAGAPVSPPAGVPVVPAARAAAPTSTADRQAAMRHAIGQLMARSKREIPHYYLSTTIDMRAATAWLERVNRERPVASRLVLPVLLLKAVARAAVAVPEVNGFYLDGAFAPCAAVHLGVAVSVRGGGVIAPAIHDVDKLTLDELMVALRDLVGRARTGSLRSSEMSDPTLTVTNLGDLGVESVFGVIYPPQVALVGFGRVVERPWAEGGMLGVRPCVTATLSADHRASDGHRGGRFLAEIDRLLQKPEEL